MSNLLGAIWITLGTLTATCLVGFAAGLAVGSVSAGLAGVIGIGVGAGATWLVMIGTSNIERDRHE